MFFLLMEPLHVANLVNLSGGTLLMFLQIGNLFEKMFILEKLQIIFFSKFTQIQCFSQNGDFFKKINPVSFTRSSQILVRFNHKFHLCLFLSFSHVPCFHFWPMFTTASSARRGEPLWSSSGILFGETLPEHKCAFLSMKLSAIF